MSHSKRNTSRSIFTSHERDLAKAAWSSNSARLNRDSFLPFGSCYLCLEVSRDPVSCNHGDIFCRECAISNLLAQKKEIKRQARTREKAQKDLLEAEARQDDEAQQRALKDFEAVQAGLSVTATAREATAPSVTTTTLPPDEKTESKAVTLKRKAVLDADEVERIAQEDRAKARRTIQEETSSKEKLPSFWAPSQTPGVDPTIRAAALQANAAKDKPICPASSDDSPHYYSLKALQPVNFTTETDTDTGSSEKRVCPSCKKLLGNSSRPILAQKCGHVFCRSCVVKLHPPAKPGDKSAEDAPACFVCDEQLKPDKSRDGSKREKTEFPGMVELRSEGTGFSARGPSKVKRAGTAFQC